jgi:oxygen-independent coproporphyrinogen III oxidase
MIDLILPTPTSGLYVHVPFCKTKCPYCDFYSITDTAFVDRWLDALEREIEGYGGLFSRFDSIYFGGGTPSLLNEPALDRLMKILRGHWPRFPGEEVTLEANPDDITRAKLLHYRSLGINRLSLGVQSFDDGELAFLKRRHTADGARKAIELVRSCGFDNFGIDLMYGLKGQTREKWLRTLGQALEYDPPHLSCYQLTIESRTPFGLLKERGGLRTLRETTERRFFLDTSRFLTDRGFIHYEISNFARTKDYVSRHNTKYWTHTPYLGIGPAAHSFHDGKRWWNHRSVDGYCESLKNGTMPVEGDEILTPEQMRLESLYLGFRTARGLAIDDLGPETRRSAALKKLVSSRLITINDRRVIPTVEGFLVADHLPLLFSD